MPYRFPAVSVLVAMAIASVAFAQVPNRESGQLIRSDELERVGLTRDWQVDLSLGSAEKVNRAQVVDDTLYVWTSKGNLFCIDRHRGLVRWSKAIDGSAHFDILGPTHLDRYDGTRLTILVTFREILLLDSYDGHQVGRIPLEFAPTSAPAVAGSMLFLGGGDGLVHALQWCETCPGQNIERWRVMTGGVVRAAPVIVPPGVIFYASTGGQVVSATALDKQGLWGQNLGTPVTVDMVAVAEGIYVAGGNGSIYRFHPASGELLQRYRLPAAVVSQPLLTGDSLFTLAADGALYALDIITGDTRWNKPDTTALLAVQEDRLALHGAGKDLVLVDRYDGRELGRVEMHRVDLFVTNRVDETVYLLDQPGRVLAARPMGTSYQRSAAVTQAAMWRHQSPAAQTQAMADAGPVVAAAPRRDRDPLRSTSTLPTLVDQTP